MFLKVPFQLPLLQFHWRFATFARLRIFSWCLSQGHRNLSRLKRIVSSSAHLKLAMLLAYCFPREVCASDSHLIPKNITRFLLAKVSLTLPNCIWNNSMCNIWNNFFRLFLRKRARVDHLTVSIEMCSKFALTVISKKLNIFSDTTQFFLGGSACGKPGKKWIFYNKAGQHFDVTFSSYGR